MSLSPIVHPYYTSRKAVPVHLSFVSRHHVNKKLPVRICIEFNEFKRVDRIIIIRMDKHDMQFRVACLYDDFPLIKKQGPADHPAYGGLDIYLARFMTIALATGIFVHFLKAANVHIIYKHPVFRIDGFELCPDESGFYLLCYTKQGKIIGNDNPGRDNTC